MTLAEVQKAKLVAIFNRRGRPGRLTKLFDEFSKNEQADFLRRAALAPTELPILGCKHSEPRWILITTSRIVAVSPAGDFRIGLTEIKEVRPPEAKAATDKQDWCELTVTLRDGSSQILTLEPGPPFIGM